MRTTLHIACIGLAAVALGAPAGEAEAKGKRLTLTAKADPHAPEGDTPKVLFALKNTRVGSRYRVIATQTSGQPEIYPGPGGGRQCTDTLGLDSLRARFKSLAFAPTPGTSSYFLGGSSPCTGTYRGKVTEKRSKRRPARVALRFWLSVPDMQVTARGR